MSMSTSTRASGSTRTSGTSASASASPSTSNQSRARYYATLDEYQLHKYTNAKGGQAKINAINSTPKTSGSGKRGDKRDRKMDYKSSKYDQVVHQMEPNSGSGSVSISGQGQRSEASPSSRHKSASIKPLAPPSSSNHDYVHPKRTSPHRERTRKDDNRNRYREEYSRRPSQSPPKRAESQPMKSMFRKSAIQDVIKTFQCNDDTKVKSTTVYSRYDGNFQRSKSRNSSRKKSGREPQPKEAATSALDNSLLESDAASAFHPFDNDSKESDNPKKSKGLMEDWLNQKSRDGSSPLRNLLEKPIQACREQFTEEPSVHMKGRSSYFERDGDNSSIYQGDKGKKTFLKLKSTWGDDDVSDVFRKPKSQSQSQSQPRSERRKVSDHRQDLFLGSSRSRDSKSFSAGTASDTDENSERFKRAAMDTVKKVIQFNNDENIMKTKKSLKGGGKSPMRAVVLNPNPRDNIPSRRSPQRERDRDAPIERTRSRGSSHSGGSSTYGEIRTVKEILKNHKYVRTKNNNLLDETLTDSEEDVPRLGIRKVSEKATSKKSSGSNRTLQTERTTPSSSRASHITSTFDPLHSAPETPVMLQDVKLTLFDDGHPSDEVSKSKLKSQAQHARAEIASKDRTVQKLDHDRKDNSTKLEELKSEWTKSQLQIKRMLADEVVEWFRNEEEASVMMTEMLKLKKSNERLLTDASAEKKAVASFKEENEALRKQMARYKAKTFHSNKAADEVSKTEDEHSESIMSSEDSNLTASTGLTHSEKFTMQAAIVDLKAKLSEQEMRFEEQKKAYEEKESAHTAQIHKLIRNRKDQKSNAEYMALETQFNTLRKNVDLHKDQLRESESYVKELEETMDKQLQVWQEEEETFRAEVKELRNQIKVAVNYEEMHREAQNRMKESHQELVSARNEVKRLLTVKENLEEKCKASIGLERSARESSEKLQETIRVEREEKLELQHLVVDFKEQLQAKKEHEEENETTIKKLKEQLKHAAFRVQVMRNESPKRKRPGNADEISEETTIAKLMQQLKAADARAEAAWEGRRLAEESLLNLTSADIVEDSDQIDQAEVVEALTRKLSDARARSRRIAVKSEEELSKLREREGDIRLLASDYEQEASKLKQKLKKVQQQYSEEFESRKRIENALRDEISLLRKEKTASAPNSPLPSSINTHSNTIGNELQSLVDIASTLHTTMSLITKAKQKIGKEILGKMMTSVEDLRTVVGKVEAAAEEDKLQVENAFVAYQAAVHSYENQIKEVTNKMKLVKDELAECQSKRSENAKKSKQTEMDMQAKFNSLKYRLAEVQKEYEEFKEEKSKPKSVSTVNSGGDLETNTARPPVDNKSDKKSWKMKLQHGASRGDVEMKLQGEDESMGGSTSQSITSFRSFEPSVRATSSFGNDQEQAQPARTSNVVSPITTDDEKSMDAKSNGDSSTSTIRSLTIQDDSSESQASTDSNNPELLEATSSSLSQHLAEKSNISIGAQYPGEEKNEESVHVIEADGSTESVASSISGTSQMKLNNSTRSYASSGIMELRGEEESSFVEGDSYVLNASTAGEGSEENKETPATNALKDKQAAALVRDESSQASMDSSSDISYHSNPHDYLSDYSYDHMDQASV